MGLQLFNECVWKNYILTSEVEWICSTQSIFHSNNKNDLPWFHFGISESFINTSIVWKNASEKNYFCIALFFAAELGKLDIYKSISDKLSNINPGSISGSLKGRTPLHIASEMYVCHNFEIVTVPLMVPWSNRVNPPQSQKRIFCTYKRVNKNLKKMSLAFGILANGT